MCQVSESLKPNVTDKGLLQQLRNIWAVILIQEQELVRIAYKKLKANLYFDKTQLPRRDRLVLFEHISLPFSLPIATIK